MGSKPEGGAADAANGRARRWPWANGERPGRKAGNGARASPVRRHRDRDLSPGPVRPRSPLSPGTSLSPGPVSPCSSLSPCSLQPPFPQYWLQAALLPPCPSATHPNLFQCPLQFFLHVYKTGVIPQPRSGPVAVQHIPRPWLSPGSKAKFTSRPDEKRWGIFSSLQACGAGSGAEAAQKLRDPSHEPDGGFPL